MGILSFFKSSLKSSLGDLAEVDALARRLDDRRDDLRERGTPGEAEILGVRDSGATKGGSDGQTIWLVQARVTVPGNAPFETEYVTVVPSEPGTRIPCWVDPADAGRVHFGG